MVYHTAVILLARPYTQSQGLANSAPDPLAQKAADILLEAARNISSLSEQYRKVFGSFRRSPITATHANLSAALALLNRPDQCRARLNSADNANIKSCVQTLKELSTAWTPPGKFYYNILKMIRDTPDQQGEAITSSVLTNHHDDSLNPTSEASHSIQPAHGTGPGPLIDEISWPSWTSTIGGDQSMGEFPATTESMPFEPSINTSWEQFDLDWFGSSLPEDFPSS